jgi:hypothetical protein
MRGGVPVVPNFYSLNVFFFFKFYTSPPRNLSVFSVAVHAKLLNAHQLHRFCSWGY